MGFNKSYIKGKYSFLKHMDFILLDIVSLIVSFSLAYFIKFHDLSFVKFENWKSILLTACLMDFTVILFSAPFSSVLRRCGSDEFIQTFKQAFRNFIFCCIALYVLGIGREFSRTVIILTYVFYWIISSCFRTALKKIIRSRMASVPARRSIFVVGKRNDMPQLLRSINSDFLCQYKVEGICIVDGEPGEVVTARIDLAGPRGTVKETFHQFTNSVSVDHIAEYVLENHIDEVFIGDNPSVIDTNTYRTLMANGKEVHLGIQPMVGFTPGNQFVTTVGTYKSLGIGIYSLDGKQLIYLTIKRIFDIFFGLIGLVILLPLMLFVKICYLADGDRKPIFYTQRRVGQDGKIFKLVKFRSMVCNADEVLKELLKDPKYKKEWDEKQKFENDPRITRIGNFLRRTSLDEMPQFLNVLKGDMSLIGPRPLVIGELEQHNGLQMYNKVKPGITGWWGCNGRSNTTYEERLALEYYYVEHCSLYLDTLCFIKTIVAVFKKSGAQ